MNKEYKIDRCKIPTYVYFEKNKEIYWYQKYHGTSYDCASNNDFDELNKKIKKLNHFFVTETEFKNNLTEENKPFKLCLLGNYRDWKDKIFFLMLDESNRILLIEPDIFTEALMNYGMDSKGNMNCEFIFAKYRNDLRIIRNDSALHKAILSYENKKRQDKIKNSELEYGRVYETPTGEAAVFLGFVTTTTYVYRKKNNENSNFKIKLNKKVINKGGLWYKISDKPDFLVKENLYKTQGKMIKTNHNYIKKTNRKFTDIDKNIINRISQHAYDVMKNVGYYHGILDYGKLANMTLYGFHPSFGDKTESLLKAINTNTKDRNPFNFFKEIEIID